MSRFAAHRRSRWRRPTPSGGLPPAIGGPARSGDAAHPEGQGAGSEQSAKSPGEPAASRSSVTAASSLLPPGRPAERPKVRVLRTEAEVAEARQRAEAQLARIVEAMGPSARERLGIERGSVEA
jgi:hypothetical protein